MTNYLFNAMSKENRKDRKILLHSLDEMRFDVDDTGNKNTRGKSLVKIFNSPAIRAGYLKNSKAKNCATRFLSSNPNEIFGRINLVL